jgi:hypothetical protein
MAKIYASAAHVTVWLGEIADESCNIFHTLNDLVKTNGHRPWDLRLSMTNQLVGLNKSFQALLKRHWFKRIWVILNYLHRSEHSH